MDDIFELQLDSLDRHWIEQPKLVHQCGLKLADTKNTMERHRAKLSVIRAEADQEARVDAINTKVKITEKIISSVVDTNDNVIKMERQLADDKHTADILSAKMVALEHRKRALEGLVSLHGQDYFAVPQTNSAGHEYLNDKETARAVRGVRKPTNKKGRST